MNVTEMKQKRAGLVNQMRALLNKAEAEKRDLNTEEKSSYDAMEKDVDMLGTQIDRAERLAKVEDNLKQQRDSNYRPSTAATQEPDERVNATPAYRKAFFDGLMRRKGINSVGPDYFAVLSGGVDSEGGYLVPTQIEAEIIKKVYEMNPIRALATVRGSALDNSIPVRTGIPTFTWIGESGTYGKSNPNYGKVAMHAHKCGGIIPISEELLQDSIANMEAEVIESAGLAFAELESVAYMTGDGVGKPFGLFAQDAVAGTAIGYETTASSTAIVADELLDVFHKLEPQYRARASWVMRDATAKLIRKLKNSVSGDYHWQPGLIAGQPDMLLGRPVVVCKDAPAVAAGAKAIAFGDLKAYRIQDRLGITVKGLMEIYAEQGQVGWRFSKRLDAKLTDANALVFLKQKA
jgi:HK97 family phage major capsid protein